MRCGPGLAELDSGGSTSSSSPSTGSTSTTRSPTRRGGRFHVLNLVAGEEVDIETARGDAHVARVRRDPGRPREQSAATARSDGAARMQGGQGVRQMTRVVRARRRRHARVCRHASTSARQPSSRRARCAWSSLRLAAARSCSTRHRRRSERRGAEASTPLGVAAPGPFDYARGAVCVEPTSSESLYGIDLRGELAARTRLARRRTSGSSTMQRRSSSASGGRVPRGDTIGDRRHARHRASARRSSSDGSIVRPARGCRPRACTACSSTALRSRSGSRRGAVLARYGDESVDVAQIAVRAREGDGRAREAFDVLSTISPTSCGRG